MLTEMEFVMIFANGNITEMETKYNWKRKTNQNGN